MLSVLKYWRTAGLDSQKVTAFASLGPQTIPKPRARSTYSAASTSAWPFRTSPSRATC